MSFSLRLFLFSYAFWLLINQTHAQASCNYKVDLITVKNDQVGVELSFEILDKKQAVFV